MIRWLWVVIAAVLVAGCGSNDDDAGETSDPDAEETSADPAEVAEQWGKAWESGDTDAVLALYSSDIDERYVVDQTFRAVWGDVEAAIDQINSANDFDRFELVRAEDFGLAVMAEYKVQWAPEDGSPADQGNVVVAFMFDPAGIVGSDIYGPPWVQFFGDDYEPREDGAWVNVN